MQLEFRDGSREVPDHLAIHMRGMETFRITYGEAITAVNDKLQRDFINSAAERFVDDHFKRMARGEVSDGPA